MKTTRNWLPILVSGLLAACGDVTLGSVAPGADSGFDGRPDDATADRSTFDANVDSDAQDSAGPPPDAAGEEAGQPCTSPTGCLPSGTCSATGGTCVINNFEHCPTGTAPDGLLPDPSACPGEVGRICCHPYDAGRADDASSAD